MWSKTYSTKVKGVSREKLWAVWTNVNQWHTWQSDIEYAKLDGEFKAGSKFLLKPKGGPKVNIEILKSEPCNAFTDLTRFPMAKMYGLHEFIDHGDELEIKTTMSVEGMLGFVWRKLVAEDVASGLKDQTEALVAKACAA